MSASKQRQRLTPTQDKIIRAMLASGLPAAFISKDARRRGFEVLGAKGGGGIIFRVYQSPQYFMERSGLIAEFPRDCEGAWYALTDKARMSLTKSASANTNPTTTKGD